MQKQPQYLLKPFKHLKTIVCVMVVALAYFYGSDPCLACICLSCVAILCACCDLPVAAHRLTIHVEFLWI